MSLEKDLAEAYSVPFPPMPEAYEHLVALWMIEITVIADIMLALEPIIYKHTNALWLADTLSGIEAAEGLSAY